MILESLEIGRAEFERRTGWIFKAEGVCKGATCIPITLGAGEKVDVRALSERLAMPLVQDPDAGLWCLGPEAAGHVLTCATAPALTRVP